ncbi:MAG: amidohydrolase family protein [Acidimicrobiia bacterium]|nr:amidohydrolase family protein [Acidimicrobiia bacterium]MDH3397311.1 amidohydrolase family protein [Acidimicrobiia bacterium]
MDPRGLVIPGGCSVAYDAGIDTTTPPPLTILKARLRHRPDLVDIEIADGRIHSVEPVGTRPPQGQSLEANENLVTESFVNTHLHLDKVFTLSSLGDAALADYQTGGMGQAMGAIEKATAVKLGQDRDAMLTAGRRALAMAAYYGNTHIRALADVDSKAGTRGVEVLLALQEEFVGIVDLQVVAFAQDGIIREPGTAELLRQCMELGANVVGGIPWIEFTEADMAEHVRICFDIAVEYDADVSMLLDDAGDPGLRTLEMMAVEALRRNWHGRALAHHARAMQLYPEPYFARLVSLLAAAGVAVVSDPHTGPLHARVKELLAAGITVSLGQDDISDGYYAFGRNNMLEVAFLGAHLLWMMAGPELEVLYDSVTTSAGRSIGLKNHRLEIGAPANLVVLQSGTVAEALRFHAAPRAVVSHGRLVDQTAMRELSAVPE